MAGSELTFGLLAIVKDESESIVRMLESAARCGIKQWCIQDTGSSDNTWELIVKTADASDVEVWLSTQRWQDFSTNRNLNIDRAFSVCPEVDYWLALDADETVEDMGGPPDLPDRLGMYHVPEKMMNEDPQIVFQAPRLIKGGSDFRYKGRAHEVLCAPTVQPVGIAEGWHLYHWSGGHDDSDAARFARNISLLKKDLKDPKADHARTTFYLGMTYERGGRSDEAERQFKVRAGMKGTWEEERWMAQFRMGCCQLRQGKLEGVDTLLRTISQRPWRAEPLIDLAAFYHAEGEDQLSQMFLPQGPFPWPVQDTLFMRPELYQPNPLTRTPVPVTS